MKSDFTDDELTAIGFMCAVYLDNQEARIKKNEKKTNTKMVDARANHAKQTRLVYTKVISRSLSGDLELLDGTTLKKSEIATEVTPDETDLQLAVDRIFRLEHGIQREAVRATPDYSSAVVALRMYADELRKRNWKWNAEVAPTVWKED